MTQQDSSAGGAPLGSGRSRVPPNQRVTETFYTLTAEDIPSVDTGSFVFKFWGAVRNPVEVTWRDLMAFPRVERTADFHCVTGWSMLGTTWGGIVVRDLLAAVHVEPAPEARFVMAHSVTEYTTNLPLEDLLADDTMLAWEWQGAPPSCRAWRTLAPACAVPVCVEGRQVGQRTGVHGGGPPGLLGGARVSHAWRSVERGAVRLKAACVT